MTEEVKTCTMAEERRYLLDFSSVRRESRALIMACILFWSILSYLFFSRFVVQATEVVGSSMVPTLWPRGRHLINRLAYRIGQPRRGDIVALKLPGDTDVSVKRIIGLPHELLQIKDGNIYINRVQLEEPYLPEDLKTRSGRLCSAPYMITSDCYFVLGDNRRDSYDSRRVGAIPRDMILGRIARP